MKVKDLIERLKDCDMDADVLHLWDGASRTAIQYVYMSKSGRCITADYGMRVHYDCDRPISAPSDKEQPYWQTPYT